MIEQTADEMRIYNELKRPFDPKTLHWRIGNTNKKKMASEGKQATKGQALAYIDARDVMKRLDDVVGFNNWQDSYEETASGRVICKLSIYLGEWISKCDGAGGTNMEGEKGGISDAFKRAAVKWGVGRCLYYLDPVWIDLENGYPPKNISAQCNKKLPKWYMRAWQESHLAQYQETMNEIRAAAKKEMESVK